MPSFSSTLEQAIHGALALANNRRHELATLEHLLLALLDEPDAARVMQACNVDLDTLRSTLEEYIEEELSTLVEQLQQQTQGRASRPEQAVRVGVPARPSLLQDVLKGRRTEVDFLNGYIVAQGEQLGVQTPVNCAIVDLMRAVERGEIPASKDNLAQLHDLGLQ